MLGSQPRGASIAFSQPIASDRHIVHLSRGVGITGVVSTIIESRKCILTVKVSGNGLGLTLLPIEDADARKNVTSTISTKDMMNLIPHDEFHVREVAVERVWLGADATDCTVVVDVGTGLIVYRMRESDWHGAFVRAGNVMEMAVGGSWIASLTRNSTEQHVALITLNDGKEQLVRLSLDKIVLGVQWSQEVRVVCCSGRRVVDAWTPQGRRIVLVGQTGLHDVVEFQQLMYEGILYAFAMTSKSILAIYKDGQLAMHPLHLNHLVGDVIKCFFFNDAAIFTTHDSTFVLPIEDMIPQEPRIAPSNTLPHLYNNQFITLEKQLDGHIAKLSVFKHAETTEAVPMDIVDGSEKWQNVFSQATQMYKKVTERRNETQQALDEVRRRLRENQARLGMEIAERALAPRNDRDPEMQMLIQAKRSGLRLVQLFGKLTHVQQTLCDALAAEPRISRFQMESTHASVHKLDNFLVLALRVCVKAGVHAQNVYLVPQTDTPWSVCRVTKSSDCQITCLSVASFSQCEWEHMLEGACLQVTPSIVWTERGTALQESLDGIEIPRKQLLSALSAPADVWPWWTRGFSHDYLLSEPSMHAVCRVLQNQLGYRQATGKDVGDDTIGTLPCSFVNPSGSIVLHLIGNEYQVRVCFRAASPTIHTSDYLLLKHSIPGVWTKLEDWDLAPSEAIASIGLDPKSFDVIINWHTIHS